MPTYQYRGIECDHVFEVHQSFADDALTKCEVCGMPVRRVIHASPVVFKGTGWYVTDSRPTSDPVGGVQDADKKSDSASKPADTSTDTSKSDSKPAAKSASAPASASAD